MLGARTVGSTVKWPRIDYTFPNGGGRRGLRQNQIVTQSFANRNHLLQRDWLKQSLGVVMPTKTPGETPNSRGFGFRNALFYRVIGERDVAFLLPFLSPAFPIEKKCDWTKRPDRATINCCLELNYPNIQRQQ